MISHLGTVARTHHAQHRHQSRATLSLFESLLLDYGSRERSYGADIVFIDKAARHRLKNVVGGKRGMRVLEPYLNQYLVVSDSNIIITTGHRNKRIFRK